METRQPEPEFVPARFGPTGQPHEDFSEGWPVIAPSNLGVVESGGSKSPTVRLGAVRAIRSRAPRRRRRVARGARGDPDSSEDDPSGPSAVGRPDPCPPSSRVRPPDACPESLAGLGFVEPFVDALVERIALRVAALLFPALGVRVTEADSTHLNYCAAAQRCGLPVSAVRRAVARGELTVVRLGPRTAVIPVAALDRWLRRRELPGRGEVRR